MIYKVVTPEEDLSPRRKVVKPKNFSNSDFNNSYKSWVKRKTKFHYFRNKTDIQKAVNLLFGNVAKLMVERDGGVVMEGLGYFAFYMPMYRRFRNIEYNSTAIVYPKYETDYYNFKPYLFTDVFTQNKLKGWSMELGFHKTLKKNSLKTHRFRKLYYKEVCKIYKHGYK